MSTRGSITNDIQEKAIELLGREISIAEFRLMPYIQYILMNNKQLDDALINEQEWSVIESWVKDGYMTTCGFPVAVTKKFWDIMSELLWMGYAS